MPVPNSILKSWLLTELLADLMLVIDSPAAIALDCFVLFRDVDKWRLMHLARHLEDAQVFSSRGFQLYSKVIYYPGYSIICSSPSFAKSASTPNEPRISICSFPYTIRRPSIIEAIANNALGQRKLLVDTTGVYY